MDLWQLTILSVVGCIAGIINVLAGGGSLLMMPIMVLMGLSGSEANGSTRVAVTTQTLAAIAAFRRRGFSDFKLSLSLSLCALPGAVVGATWGTKLDGPWFYRILAGVMVAVLIFMSRKNQMASQRDSSHAGSVGMKRYVLAHGLMFGIGLYGGFIQAGVGLIMMPVLYKVLKLDLVRVNMHKVFIVAVYIIPTIAVYAWNHKVVWWTAIALAAGTSVGGWIGAHITIAKGERAIRLVFQLALVALAVRLLLLSLNGSS